MAAEYSDPRMRFFLGDVRDHSRLALALRGVDTVLHAAAMKRIDACESDPTEAVATNIRGTQNVALACVSAGVTRAVVLSTDKAPAATTLYGATKFAAERLWLASNVYAGGRGTRLTATRYGNVLGSRGSVLDRWRTQRDVGVPLTITDEHATRFWMTMAQAVQLVADVLAMMDGGETFVPRIGSAPILDLARAVVEGPNGEPYAPGHVVAGLRAGERLHETLIAADERRRTLATCYVLDAQGDTDEPYRSDTNPNRLTVRHLREMIA